MANDYSITITYKLDTGDAAGKAAEAGQRDAKAYENAFKGSVDLTKALKPGDAGRQIGEQAGASLADAIGKSRTLVDRLRGEMLAKAFPQAAAGAAPPQFLPPPSVRGAPEDFARRMQPVVSGMEAFAMLLRGAPLLSVAQMAGQALTGLGRGAAPERPSGPAAYRFYGMPTGEAEAIRRAEAGGEDRIAEIQARNRAAAAGEAAEGGMGKMAGGLVKGGLIATAIAEIGKATYDLATALGGVGEKAVDASTETHDLADTLEISTEEFHKLEDRVARSGASVHEYGRALTRTAITAKEQMPAIEHAIATSADVLEESNIRVRDSERAVEQARDNRRLATDKVSSAEGELIKVQETGAQQREEQRRAAELGVSGAQIGARGAQMGLAQAGIQAQFARQQQQLADIAGPLTVKGAELGAKGARISAEEARARLHEVVTGHAEDPDVVRRREIRKAALAVEVAQHNVEQADLHEQQADLAERQRKRMQAAGLGPVGQAQQQLLQAAQAAEEADLHVQQTATAKQRLEIDQQHNTLQMEENRAQAGVAAARRGVGAAADEQTQAEINLRKQTYEAEQARYNDIKTAQKFLQGGEMEPGFDPRRITPEAFRGAIFREGRGAPGGIPEALSKYLQTPGLDFAEREKRVSEIFPRLLRGGPQALADYTRSLAKPPSEVAPEDEALRRQLSRREDLTREAAEEARATRAADELRAERRAELTGLTPQALRAYADKQIIDRGLAVTEDFLKRRALGIPGEAFQPAEPKPPEQAKPAEQPTEPPATFKERFPTLPPPPVEEKPALPSAGAGTQLPEIQVKPEPEVKSSEAAASLDKLAASASDAAAALDKLKESAAAGGKAGAGAGGAATTGGAAAGVATGGAAGAAGAGGDIWSQLAQTGAAQISPGGAMIRLTEQEMLRQQQMRGMVSGAAAAGAGPAAGGGAGGGDIWSRLAQTGREQISPGGAEIIYTPQELARQRQMRGIGSGAGGGDGGGGAAGAAATGGGGVAGSTGAGPDGWPVGIPRGGSFANVPWSSTRDFSEPVKFGPTGHVKSVGRAGSLPVYDVDRHTYDVDLKTGLPRAQQGQPGWHEQQQQAQRERERARQEEETRRQEEEARKRREEEATQEMQGADELATGGLVGGHGSGKSDSNIIRVSKGEYVVTADGSNLKDAIAHFTNGFARGGLVGGFADAVAHIPGYAGGGPVTHASAGGNSLGHHSLDIRTNAGSFTAHVSEDTMEAIRKSSLGGKLSQTGPRPTWYS